MENNIKNNNFITQLLSLKAMTIRTGAIHEAQALQLRNWPLVLPNVKSAEVHVDTDNKIVEYLCTPKSNVIRKTKKMLNMCTLIDKFTKTILWDDTTVIIKIGDKNIYDSRSK